MVMSSEDEARSYKYDDRQTTFNIKLQSCVYQSLITVDNTSRYLVHSRLTNPSPPPT
jgi:hypothetical protein